MAKILLLSILLVAVYQFDELARAAHFAYTRIRHKKYKQLLLDSDHYVGTVLAMAGMPLALNILLVSDMPLLGKLFIIGGMFLAFSIISAGLEIFTKRLRHVSQYESIGAFVGFTYALAGLFHPVLRSMPWHGSRANKELAKLAFLLSLPALLGFGFKLYFDQGYQNEFSKYIDSLIIVMVGGAFINIMIRFLEDYLPRTNLGFFGYVRIVAGLAISVILFL